jgi:hypothetical protein
MFRKHGRKSVVWVITAIAVGATVALLFPSIQLTAGDEDYTRIIRDLTSHDSGTRTRASQELFGRGVRYKPIYDYLEQLILQAGLKKNLVSCTPDEIAGEPNLLRWWRLDHGPPVSRIAGPLHPFVQSNNPDHP